MIQKHKKSNTKKICQTAGGNMGIKTLFNNHYLLVFCGAGKHTRDAQCNCLQRHM